MNLRKNNTKQNNAKLRLNYNENILLKIMNKKNIDILTEPKY